MVKRVLATVFGLLLIGLGIAGILFVTALAGLSSGVDTFSYLMMAALGVGLFGPLVVLGLQCAWLRWVLQPRRDRYAIAACILCSLVGTAAIAISATGTPNSNVATGYIMLFILSASLCGVGIKIGRFGTSSTAQM